jgi:putative ABC transport system substrate-binding protein
MLELIREMIPKAATIVALVNPNRPEFQLSVDEVLRAARSINLGIHVIKAGNEREIDSAFAELHHLRADALVVLSDPIYTNRRDQIAKLEASYAIPAIYPGREHVVAGGLMSYGASIENSYQQAGNYAGRILKGEKPANLPVQQPTKFEFVINLKTAKALGLDVPDRLLALADEVIE